MLMNVANQTSLRAGKQYRNNPERFFHVMTQGWYVFTREGICGPFIDRDQATSYLKAHIQDAKNPSDDPSAKWRL